MRSAPSRQTDDFLAELRQLGRAGESSVNAKIRRVFRKHRPDDGTLREILDAHGDDTDLAMVVVYGWVAQLWTSRRDDLVIDVVDAYESLLGEQALYDNFRTKRARARGENVENLREARGYADKAVRSLPESGGTHLLYAETVELLAQRDRAEAEVHLSGAVERARRAVTILSRASIRSVPKAHRVLAMLLAHQGRFDEARMEIRNAVVSENRKSERYAEFMAAHRLAELHINLMEEQARSRALEDKARTELGELRGQLIGSMGLLAAVIALVLSITTSGGVAEPFAERAGLVVVLSGTLLLAFSGFSAVFGVARPRIAALTGVVGAAVGGIGVCLGLLIG